MTEVKRIMISIPNQLLQEIDSAIRSENCSRSELIREAMKHFLEERKKRDLRERMKKGYQEMARINLAYADEACATDERSLQEYEHFIAEEK